MECKCGLNAPVAETRRRKGYRYRRYNCECGERYNSVEIVTTLRGPQVIERIADDTGLTLLQKLAIKNLIDSFNT